MSGCHNPLGPKQSTAAKVFPIRCLERDHKRVTLIRVCSTHDGRFSLRDPEIRGDNREQQHQCKTCDLGKPLHLGPSPSQLKLKVDLFPANTPPQQSRYPQQEEPHPKQPAQTFTTTSAQSRQNAHSPQTSPCTKHNSPQWIDD